ncbi:class I SAM-dependent methyltransferase [Polaromonas sp. UBA4122]|uniref:class I SAM-dependent methyltransferase n=1 Tax=Polaromonas sp. UBA4122 TaxID=1947074 RepID=UPI0025EE0AB6|nr:class I SAM-dependent methyltransferase [Polaromonas sp. UBA4122]
MKIIVTTNVSDGIFANMAPPSPWVQRWSHLVPDRGVVLDVACGHGRHARWFYERNHPVVLVDRSQAAIESIAIPAQDCEAVVADIETGPWPFAGRQFDAVLVTNYLWRPLIPTLLNSLAPGGVLIYETFTQGNETVGKPSRPDFLLRPGELLELCRGLRVVAFEEGFQEDPQGLLPRFIQRIAAVREAGNHAGLPASLNQADTRPPRYRLP